MAEQVNQRIEEMINELEQMRRTELFDDEEIKEISRKRKEFEYHIQRRVKHKEDYIQYIAYELALLEDISIRRKQAKLTEKKNVIEMAIARRLNKLFKQFIYRFQNEIEVYFEYIRFCRAVGFEQAISGILGQMLQIHGDKPKVWQMASKWESEEQNNLNNARNFLLKGIQRHPESEVLFLELFNIELMELVFNAESEDDKIKSSIVDGVVRVVYLRPGGSGCHWQEIEQYVEEENSFPKEVNNFICMYEEALQQFPDEKLCTKYIHELLGVSENICTDYQKIRAVKHAWMYGHENALLTDDMYAFGIEMLILDNEKSNEELNEILNFASKRNPQYRSVWEEKLLLNKSNEKKMIAILQDATRSLKASDALHLYNLVLENVESNEMLKSLHKKFQSCENSVLLEVKPKLLQQMFKHNGLKAARDLYEDLIKTPPPQIEVHKIMIDIEKSQEKINVKNIRKCFECAVNHHGSDNVDIWMDYMKFEIENGNAQASPLVYRRAIGMLKKELVDEFIKAQTMAKIK
ncbi:hypothetical protein K1T71_006271 [Dendrolimus kikuchii]|uniref:Uncharacterized protein n=1 Tax=Dendrolimus kikuchii TaxID=765133 RepID=A0ACC1D3F2_9NEOP|nr:hypothetical protein K1T71_006271 [Dendrolimus kikuchii]